MLLSALLSTAGVTLNGLYRSGRVPFAYFFIFIFVSQIFLLPLSLLRLSLLQTNVQTEIVFCISFPTLMSYFLRRHLWHFSLALFSLTTHYANSYIFCVASVDFRSLLGGIHTFFSVSVSLCRLYKIFLHL